MHIVVVDPSRVVLKMVAGLLEPRGYTVTTFTDSREALAFVTDEPSVDTLITSLETRPITGLELCWAARLLAEARRPLYIIVMSSLQNPRNVSEALDSGADDFITKPPVAEELHARLRAAQRLTSMQRDLIRLAETDPLSGLLNRRAFFQRLKEASERAGDFGKLSLIMADVDHFKSVNDTHGHDVGDAVIQTVASELSAMTAKDHGIVGRLGGEEFAVVLPGQAGAYGADVAGSLRARIAELRIKGQRGPIKLTCSFGVSEWSEGETVESLLKRADIALYEAKTTGRNRVVLASTDVMIARTG